MSEDGVVHAAGGIIWRREEGKRAARILVVHRPRYDDWSLPKGKAEAGETAEETARREVEEETGLRCRLGPEVGTTRYRDSRGRPKEVRYWLMEPPLDPSGNSAGTDHFEPNHEVDRLRWCSPAAAGRLLTYDHDRRLVASVAEELG